MDVAKFKEETPKSEAEAAVPGTPENTTFPFKDGSSRAIGVQDCHHFLPKGLPPPPVAHQDTLPQSSCIYWAPTVCQVLAVIDFFFFFRVVQ